jgi:hypothetical protein
MVKTRKQPLFKTDFPKTNFVIGELPRNYSVPPVTFGIEQLSSYLSDDCNTVITLDSNHPHIKIPPLSVVTRNPYCRKLPSPPPPTITEEYSEAPTFPPAGDGDGFYWIYKPYDLGDYNNGYGGYYDGGLRNQGFDRFGSLYNSSEQFIEIQSINWENGEVLGNYLNADYTLQITIKAKRIEEQSLCDLYNNRNWSGDEGFNYYLETLDANGIAYTVGNRSDPNSILSIKQETIIVCRYNHTLPRWMQTFLPEYFPDNYISRRTGVPEILGATLAQAQGNLNPYVYVNDFVKIEEFSTFPVYSNAGFPVSIKSKFSPRTDTLGEEFTDFYGQKYWLVTGSIIKAHKRYHEIKWIEAYTKPDEPPPPPPPMSCCPNVRENDALLRLILKRIGTPLTVNIRDYDETTKGYQPYDEEQVTLFNAARINTNRAEVINDIIGIAEYPITAPKSIIEDYKLLFPEGIDDLWGIYDDSAQPTELANLTQFLNWQVEQESAVMGGWHQIIEYDNNGKKEICRLVNIAETLKELIIIQVGQNRDNSILTDLCARIISELIVIKGNVIRGNHIIEDIQDYLDYPTQEKIVNFPIPITTPEPGKSLVENESLKQLLRPSTMKVTYQDWTGASSLHDKLLDLLQAAATIRGIGTESGEELLKYGKYPDAKAPNDDAFNNWIDNLGK